MTKEEILDENNISFNGLDESESAEKQLHIAMDQYAKNQSIKFAEWLHINNWRQEYLTSRWYKNIQRDGTFAIESVYELFLKDTVYSRFLQQQLLK